MVKQNTSRPAPRPINVYLIYNYAKMHSYFLFAFFE